MFLPNQKPPLGARLNWAHPLSKGLVGNWLMNERSGNKIYDSSLNGNDGTLTNMSPQSNVSGWVPGIHGPALAFDGSNDWVSLGSNAVLKPMKWSIIASVICYATTSSISAIFIPVGSNGYEGGFLLGANTNNANPFIRTGTGSGPLKGCTSGPTCLNNFRTICATFDGETISLFVDGIFRTSVSGCSTYGYQAGGTAQIGLSGGVSYLNGAISYISFYNRTLTAQEVALAYTFPYCMYDDVTGMQDWYSADSKRPALALFDVRAALNKNLIRQAQVTVAMQAEVNRWEWKSIFPTFAPATNLNKRLTLPISPTFSLRTDMGRGSTFPLSPQIRPGMSTNKQRTMGVYPTVAMRAALSHRTIWVARNLILTSTIANISNNSTIDRAIDVDSTITTAVNKLSTI